MADDDSQTADSERTPLDKLRDDFAETLPDGALSTNGDSQAGAKIGNAIAGQLASLTVNILLMVTRLMPFSTKFWRGLINAGYKGLLKTSGGDALGHLMVGGELQHHPLEWEHDEGQYQTVAGEEFWNSPDDARNHYRGPGNTSCVWASAGSTELGSHVQAETAEALDLGQGSDLYQAAEVTEISADPDQLDQAGQAALSDGGVNRTHQPSKIVSVNNVRGWQDKLVDLSHDADARVVSMSKYAEIYPERTATDEMNRQEQRGRLAEMDPGARKSFIIKVLLIALGIIAVVILGPPLVTALLGGGGGGAGVSIPTLTILGGL